MNIFFSNCENEFEQLRLNDLITIATEPPRPKIQQQCPNEFIKSMDPKPLGKKENPNEFIKSMDPKVVIPKKPREYKPCERLLKELKKKAKKGLYLND